MSKSLSLLDDSDSDVEFSVNKNYADRYNVWRNKEELQKLKDLSKDISDSSSESEEEDDPIIEKDFLKTLSLLKGKDPKIYNENLEFFKDEVSAKKPKAKKEKPLFLKDYESQAALQTNGEFSDNEEFIPAKGPTFKEEEDEIKKSFKEALKDSDDESDEKNLFQVRSKTKTQEDSEEVDYMQWLKGHKKEIEKNAAQEMKFLKTFWSDPKLDNDEKFLRDYILNEKYKDSDKTNEIPTYNQIVDDVEDEKVMEQQEMFEHKYNFRFEEPDAEFIKRYPRTIGDSLRRDDNKRKMKRDDYAERKKKEKEQKKEELKRLKALKRKEIEEKFLKLKEVSGREEINFDEEDIESDFDPDKHDRKMKELFNDDYYTVEEVQKPEFEYDGELDDENWDHWTREQNNNKASTSSKPDDTDNEEDSDVEENDDKDNEKLQFEKEMIESTRGRKKGKKKSLFSKIISQPKPIFDPDGKSFNDYLEEYYKMDYEDVIGDLPVKFKYRKVVPNDFGLTPDEILAANDKELNKWCSVKKTCQYRRDEEEFYDVQAFKKKAENVAIKEKILSSVYTQPKDSEAKKHVAEESVNSDSKSKRKRKKKKNKSLLNAVDETRTSFSNEKESVPKEAIKSEVPLENSEAISKRKRKRNRKALVKENSCTIDGDFKESLPVRNESNTLSLNVENVTTEEVKNKSKRKKKNKKLKIDASNDSPNVNDSFNIPDQKQTPNKRQYSDKNGSISSSGLEDFSASVNKIQKKRNLDALHNDESLLENDTSSSSKKAKTGSFIDSKPDTSSLQTAVKSEMTANSGVKTDDNTNSSPSKRKRNKKKKNKNVPATFGKPFQNKQNFNAKHSQSNFKPSNVDNETNKKLALSDSRLAAFGINAKKFKNSLIYSKKT